ncbi:MAG: type II secretion system F family protein [Lachnospiraceae bacterium]|nr:type II secretion system F family protein [Lachnospiraceae bacterium]
MNEVTIHKILQAVQLLMALLIGLQLLRMALGGRTGEVVLRAYDTLCMHARRKKGRFWDYQKWEEFLRTNGAAYHYGGWINPVSYLTLCLALAGAGCIIGLYLGLLPGIAAAVLAACLPGLLLERMNRRDNEAMLPDLNLLYHALAIQIRAGVYVTDALAEVYGSVKQIRLRDGLQALSGDIVMKADLGDALERFQGQFNNRYIDSLCITILQAMESGQAVELLGDIADQIRDMELTLQSRKKERLDRSVTFYQLGIFAAIIAVVLYACVEHMFQNNMFMS